MRRAASDCFGMSIAPKRTVLELPKPVFGSRWVSETRPSTIPDMAGQGCPKGNQTVWKRARLTLLFLFFCPKRDHPINLLQKALRTPLAVCGTAFR
jgi:hypothetical protein